MRTIQDEGVTYDVVFSGGQALRPIVVEPEQPRCSTRALEPAPLEERCARCGQRAVKGKTRCLACAGLNAQNNRAWRQRQKTGERAAGHGGKAPLAPKVIRRIQELRAAGVPMMHVALQLGVSHVSVVKYSKGAR